MKPSGPRKVVKSSKGGTVYGPQQNTVKRPPRWENPENRRGRQR